MLKDIFGNKTAEHVLLHLFHYGESYASAVSADFKMSLTPIRYQLERFERSGVLVSKLLGKTRVYAFNPKSPLTRPVKELIGIIYDSIPLREREQLFQARRRPRRKGKPVL